MEVTIGDLPAARWPEAGAMAGRAFWREDYNRVLSEDPIERFAIVQDIYLRMNDPAPPAAILAAFAGDHVVGVACVDAAGACYFCSLDPTKPTRTDPVSQALFGVNLAIKGLHVDLPAHAYIGPIAVEPTLQGHGIGRRLVEAAFDRAARRSADGRPGLRSSARRLLRVLRFPTGRRHHRSIRVRHHRAPARSVNP